MASQQNNTSEAAPKAQDQTFRNYKADAAAAYLAYRPPYPAKLIEMVVKAHTSTKGGTTRVLDIGCGPGQATRQLAPYFQHVVGADPGESMIATARNFECTSASGEAGQFKVCDAEHLENIVEPASVDLITAATAAHWFNLPSFYVSAAKVLRPGGSIIFWATGSNYCDPVTTPNAAEVTRLWNEFELKVMQPFELPGNKLTRELYEHMEMPWTVQTDDPAVQAAMSQFDPSISKRETFNKDGVLDDRFEHGFLRYHCDKMARLKLAVGTASPVTRWREAHREQLEQGEIEDCVDRLFRLTKEAFEKVGHGDVDEIGGGTAMVIVVIKKRKDLQ